jgi:hypothetical protein
MNRDEWESCENAYTLMRCIGGAHVRGTIPRRRLVQVTLRCVEPVAYLLSDESLTALADLTAWSHGADDVDVDDVSRRLLEESAAARSHYAAAYAAADYAAADYAADAAAHAANATDADVAAGAAEANAARAVANAADAAAHAADAAAHAADAAAHAADAAAHAADVWDAYTAAKAALCDVIRDEIAFEEIQ